MTRKTKWKASFWYPTTLTAAERTALQEELEDELIPSEVLDDAYKNVIDVFLRHQSLWDNVQEVEEVDENSDDDVDIDIEGILDD